MKSGSVILTKTVIRYILIRIWTKTRSGLRFYAALLLMIQEILFSAGAAFCYFATGIACAVYADAWGGPPDGCPDNDDDPCDSRPLTATNALQVVSWCKI